MYTIGDDFEFEINENTEYFTCVAEFQYSGFDYLICESDEGIKKVFYYDNDYERLVLVDDEEEEEDILEQYQTNTYKMDEESFDFWEDGEISDYERYNENDPDEENLTEDDVDLLGAYDVEDYEIEDFVDDLFSDDEFYSSDYDDGEED